MDNLAAMTQRGFARADEKFDSLETRVGKGFFETKEEFSKVNERLDKFEFLLIGRQDRRLDKVEDDLRVIKTLLEKKLDATFPRK